MSSDDSHDPVPTPEDRRVETNETTEPAEVVKASGVAEAKATDLEIDEVKSEVLVTSEQEIHDYKR